MEVMEVLQVEVCDVCGGAHSTELCPELGLDESDLANAVISRARLTLPFNVQVVDLPEQEVGVFAQESIVRKTQFGPFEAKKTTHEFNDDGLFILKIFIKDGGSVSLDTTDENECNWLCLVRAASNTQEQNCMVYQLGTSIFYNTMRDIHPGEELKVWYATQYARKLGKPVLPDGTSRVMLGMKVIYPTVEELPEISANSTVMQDHPIRDHGNDDLKNEQQDISGQTNQDISSVSESNLDAGFDSNIDSDLPFKCKRCDLQFETEPELANHIRDHLVPMPTRRGRKPGDNSKKRIEEKVKQKSLRMITTGKYLNKDENESSKTDNNNDDDTSALVASDDDDEAENLGYGSEEEFSPTKPPKVSYNSPGKRVMPRRSLRGVRTTGFEEYVVMTKTVSKRKRNSLSLEEEDIELEKGGISVENVMVTQNKEKNRNKVRKTDATEKTVTNISEDGNTEEHKSVPVVKRGRGRPRKHPVSTDNGPKNMDIGDSVEIEQKEPIESEKSATTTGTVVDNIGKLVDKELGIVDEKSKDNAVSKSQGDVNENQKVEDTRNEKKEDSFSDLVEMVELVNTSNNAENLNGENLKVDGQEVQNSKSLEEVNVASKISQTDQNQFNTYNSKNEVSVTLNENTEARLNGAVGDSKVNEVENVSVTNQSFANRNNVRIFDSAEPFCGDLGSSEGYQLKTVTETKKDIAGAEESTLLVVEDLVPNIDVGKSNGKLSQELTNSHEDGEQSMYIILDKLQENAATINNETETQLLSEQSAKEINGVVDKNENSQSFENIETGTDEVKEDCSTNDLENGSEDKEDLGNEMINDSNSNSKGLKGKRSKEKPLIPMIIRDTEHGKEYVCSICNKKFTTERYLRLHAPAHTDQFKCQYCGSRYTRKDSLLKHECKISEFLLIEEGTSENGTRTLVKCKKCEIEFETEEDGKTHVIDNHSAIPFYCEWCHKEFSSQKHYKIHKCENKSEEEKPFPCDICNQAFVSEKYLFRHMAMHTDIFKCKKCFKRFSRKDSLQRHVLKCCPDSAHEYDLFACKICLRTFSTVLGLQNHEIKCQKLRCFSCNKIFGLQEELDQHKCADEVKTENANDVKFSCDKCKKSFRNLDYLRRHKLSHEGKFCCSICKKYFKCEDEMQIHFRYCKAAVLIRDEGKVTCAKCDEEFATVKSYREHFYTHTHPYKCENCDRNFIKIGSLHTHVCGNTSSGEFSCGICLKVFSHEKYLIRHMECHGEYKFFCEYCGKKFHRRDYYKDHICKLPDGTNVRIVRSEDELHVLEKLVCHVCGKEFVSSSNLNKHMKIHGDKKCSCPVCGKKFHQDEYLKMHIAGVHEKKFKYQCSECGKVLTSKPGLMCHMKQMHSEQKEVYPCHKCGKLFSQKGNLKTHMYSHTKERLFSCTYCPKNFKYPDQLNRHNLIHTMENKLQCEHCDKKFVKGYELNKHYQVNHSGMMYVCEFCGARCSHRHTVMRHYKRKHPAHSDLVKDTDYLNGLFKLVDKEDRYLQEQIMTVQTEAQQIMIGDTVTVGDVLPQMAAEALHSLSTGGISSGTDIQTVQVANDGTTIINADGTVMMPAGNDGTFAIQGVQQAIEGVDGQSTVVILQIMNPHDNDQIMEEEVQIQELETTQIVETTPVADTNIDSVAEEITAVTSFVQNFG